VFIVVGEKAFQTIDSHIPVALRMVSLSASSKQGDHLACKMPPATLKERPVGEESRDYVTYIKREIPLPRPYPFWRSSSKRITISPATMSCTTLLEEYQLKQLKIWLLRVDEDIREEHKFLHLCWR
jgi:hypothetical protein